MTYNEAKRKANDKYDTKNMVAYTVKYQKKFMKMLKKL